MSSNKTKAPTEPEIFYMSVKAAVKQLDSALELHMRHFRNVLESGEDLCSVEEALDEGTEILKKYRQVIEEHRK